jgi:hypothetical protein
MVGERAHLASPLLFLPARELTEESPDPLSTFYLGNGVPGGILAASSGLNLPSRSMSAASLFVRFSLSLDGSLPMVELEPPAPGAG